MAKRILILGGTTEAAELARRITFVLRTHVEVILSLAGRTRAPAPQPVAVRSGGFGGAKGLADYLRRENIALVVDATHPFAATMSAHAREACAEVGIPRLQWVRPAWTIPADARIAWPPISPRRRRNCRRSPAPRSSPSAAGDLPRSPMSRTSA
jgi:precorrin-6A/cobalt-precorrin-6A reductase